MKKAHALIAALTVLIALVAANFLVARHPVRLDLTQNRIFTLSDSTRKILAGLDDVVTVRIYFTEELPPALQDLRRDVDDLLAEFKGAAGRRLQVEHIDPGASSLEEQQAAMIGIPPVQLNVLDRDKAEVAKVFLGMAVLFAGRQQVIPVVQRIDNLEYDLAEAIVKVSSKALPKVAWWEEGVDEAKGDGFTFIREAISRRYDVAKMDGKAIADLGAKNFGALVLASPRKLSADELFAIDQYLMGGGRIIALIDRFEVAGGSKLSPVESDAVGLFAHYGATVEDALVVDQQNAMAAFSGGIVTYHLPYPYWPQVQRGQFAAAEPIVANLESVVLPWTSPIAIASSDGQTVALAESSPYSTVVPGKEVRLDPQSAGEALISGKRAAQTLVAMLSGPFGSLFAPGGEAPPAGRGAIAEGSAEARLIVVGSSHWLTDRLLSTFPANAALFENALDSFAMGDLLIGIRSRENTQRPLVALADGERLALKYLNIAVGPIIVLMIGAIVLIARRRRRRAVQAAYR